MEEQTPNSEFNESERLDFLTPEDLEAMRLMESNELIIKESLGDDTLRRLLAARELYFDRAVAQDNMNTGAQGALRIISELIRGRKSQLGIDPTLEP